MNKQLIVATVTAALMAPVASHAVEATLYGSIRAGLATGDDGALNSDRRLDLGATGTDGTVSGQGLYSRIGIRGETDLGNGLSAGLQVERDVDDDFSTRHTNVWISGGFGRLTFGQQGNPYRNARNWDQNYFLGGQESVDLGSRIEGIKYSMSSGPFNLNVMAVADDTRASAAREDSDGIDNWVFHAGYDFGVVAVNVGHETDETEDVTTAATDATVNVPGGAGLPAMVPVTPASDAVRGPRSNTAIGFNGSVGQFQWYLAYETSELENDPVDNDIDSWGGFVSFDPSDNDRLYAYHVRHSRDVGSAAEGEDTAETILGYSHSFGGGVSFIAEYLTHDKDLPSGSDLDDPNALVVALKVDF